MGEVEIYGVSSLGLERKERKVRKKSRIEVYVKSG